MTAASAQQLLSAEEFKARLHQIGAEHTAAHKTCDYLDSVMTYWLTQQSDSNSEDA